jgi:hypothetical protein
LVLAARQGPPQSLIGVGHEAENQFAGHVPSQQALGIGKISLCDLEARD